MRERLGALRAELSRLGLDGFVVPRADQYLGEYVPARAERLAWLTGFTGSAGTAAVLMTKAALFTDGRYTLQARNEIAPALFELLHMTEQPAPAWLASHLGQEETRRIGYDPWLMSEETLARYSDAGLTMAPLASNPIDALWLGRPAAPAAPAAPHPLKFAGMAAAEKIQSLASALKQAGQDACVITDPPAVNWLLNIRGADVPFIPIALGFAVLHADARVDLYMDPAKLSEEIRAWLGPAVACRDEAAFEAGLAALSGRRIRVDRAGAPAAVAQILRGTGAQVVDGADLCQLPKARKNAAEQEGARAAHRRDAAALCRFLHWLDGLGAVGGSATELSAAARLLAFRQQLVDFRGESFPAISGAGEHGAVIHYRVSAASDRALGPNEIYLIDSGAQFLDGTTDVTRTVWTGPAEPPPVLRERFTRVLQGHIALAATIFPQGVAGPHLDAIARRPLWAAGLDYDHGTGHGVGSYLSVHEGPCSLSRAARAVPIEAGMILSDEPGFYAAGEYGIRLENLLLVQAHPTPGPRAFLRFDILTLAPFDRRLLEPGLLNPAERHWLNDYHARVLEEVGPLLDQPDRGWLVEACAAI